MIQNNSSMLEKLRVKTQIELSEKEAVDELQPPRSFLKEESTQILQAIADQAELIDQYMEAILPLEEQNDRLLDAMRYSLFSPGKKIRSYLLIEVAKIFNAPLEEAIKAASSIEMIHCYSLIHDDLPAMDNDDLRRGKPTCHIKFDEATAILAGDALLTIAFEVLAEKLNISPIKRCNIISCLAKAIGYRGMAGGQMRDLFYQNKQITLEEAINMENMKTSMLFSASASIGAIMGDASEREVKNLEEFGLKLGLAFQIIDDIIDLKGDENQSGKKLRKDDSAGKATIVKFIGEQKALALAEKNIEEALELIKPYNSSYLELLTDFILKREF